MCASSVHRHSRQQRASRLAERCCQETGCLSWSTGRSAGLPDQSSSAASQQCCWSLDRVNNPATSTANTFQVFTFGTYHSFWPHFLSHTHVELAEFLSADIREHSILNSFFVHVQPVYAVVFTALCLTFTGPEFLLSHCWWCGALVMMHSQDYGNTKCQLRQNVSFLCMLCRKVQIFSDITEPYKSSPCPHTTSWRSILLLSYHLLPNLPSSLFPSGLPTKPLCSSLLSHICDMSFLQTFVIWGRSWCFFRRKQIWNMAVMLHKYTHTHAHTRARTHTHTHTQTHTLKKHTVFHADC